MVAQSGKCPAQNEKSFRKPDFASAKRRFARANQKTSARNAGGLAQNQNWPRKPDFLPANRETSAQA
jgi:hypothetical protein